MEQRPITTALRAAVSFARDAPSRCDERTIESLLWGALNESRSLAKALTGRDDLRYRLGGKDRADVSGFAENNADDALVVIEVKLRAAFHWRKAIEKSQLDAYSNRNPDAALVLVASDSAIKKFHARGTGEYHRDGWREFDSYDKWNEHVTSLDDLLELLEDALVNAPPDPSAEAVARIVARKSD